MDSHQPDETKTKDQFPYFYPDSCVQEEQGDWCLYGDDWWQTVCDQTESQLPKDCLPTSAAATPGSGYGYR